MSPERWLVLTVESPSDEMAPLLAEGLVACGGGAVEENGRQLRTYIPPPDMAPEEFVRQTERTLAGFTGERVAVAWEWRAHEDWSERWKRGLEPRRVGKRFIVTPTWCAPEADEDDIVLAIDPEMAFGTGEHATTRAVLRLLERAMGALPQRAIGARATVLDIGTGSGILAIAAARLGADHVDAVECDVEALPYAQANIVRNGAADRVALLHALVDDTYLADRRGRYDLILANVLSGVLRPLVPAMRAALRPGGAIVLGGILTGESVDIEGAARSAGLRVVEEDVEDEWWTAWLA